MNPHTFTLTGGIVFSLIAGLHMLRLLLKWEAVIGTWKVPHWISWIALWVSGYLAYSAFTLGK